VAAGSIYNPTGDCAARKLLGIGPREGGPARDMEQHVYDALGVAEVTPSHTFERILPEVNRELRRGSP
jgi:hypothetical protein